MGIISKVFKKRKFDRLIKKAIRDRNFRFQMNISKDNTPLIQVLPQDVFQKQFEIKDEDGFVIVVLTGSVIIRDKNFKESEFYSVSHEIDIEGKKQLIFMERNFEKLGETLKELLLIVFDINGEENYTTEMIVL
ncbi:hypothetical protein [uncultured Nonlabens sp.]|uniref:hypothetical protein n=1 Tax=uncultured Nonlabens sp. TaxID=859306 RepID=UPI00261F7F45|nr:hypothetical protein [uncultured Nonlabens sp.]